MVVPPICLDFLLTYCGIDSTDKAGVAAAEDRVAAVQASLLHCGHLHRSIATGRWLKPSLPSHPAFGSALAAIRAEGLWVDIGCGLGVDVRAVKSALRDVAKPRLLAVDTTPALWEAGLAAFGDECSPPANFLLADAAASPFVPALSRRSASALSVMHVLHTLAEGDASRMLRGIAAVLAPGGFLLGITLATLVSGGRALTSPNGSGAPVGWLLDEPSLFAALAGAGLVDVVVASTVLAKDCAGPLDADICMLTFSARAPREGTFCAGLIRAIDEAAPLLAAIGEADVASCGRVASLRLRTRDDPPSDLDVLLSAEGGAEVPGGLRAGSLHELLMAASSSYRKNFSAAVASRLACTASA